jgi:uncharacterized small protein (DUF1192 family)
MSITTRKPDIPEEQITPLVAQLLSIIELQMEEIQLLKDEIARLKGQKPKPKIKPSSLEKRKPTNKRKKPKKRAKKSKSKKLEIHEVVCLAPEHIPAGSTFKGYQDYLVQDLIISKWNICYRRQRWQTPDGRYICGRLPKPVTDTHYGPTLTAFILYQYYGCHVTQPLIAEQLAEMGVQISAAQINNIVVHNKKRFHDEKDQILATGLKISGHIHVDDTGARHDGKNGFCTHIGNDLFAWFKSTESKSRINFLQLLQVNHGDYVINEAAIEYMKQQSLPKYQLAQFTNRVFANERKWKSFLYRHGVRRKHHKRIATEAALVGSLVHHGWRRDMVIVSDDAGQFNVFLHALCWVHAERAVAALIGFTDHQRRLLESVKDDIWNLYRRLKAFRHNPENKTKDALEKQFDDIFNRKTGYAHLDVVLGRIWKNKPELLLVLDRPDIPLHNNLSERDIREYVKRRKISGSTRSETGRRCRDAFTSLKKTCRKLNISFWRYLLDRVSHRGVIPPLGRVMIEANNDRASTPTY